MIAVRMTMNNFYEHFRQFVRKLFLHLQRSLRPFADNGSQQSREKTTIAGRVDLARPYWFGCFGRLQLPSQNAPVTGAALRCRMHREHSALARRTVLSPGLASAEPGFFVGLTTNIEIIILNLSDRSI